MRTDTRLAFNAYCEVLAQLNGVPSATTSFTINPAVQQKLETKIQESSDFLGQINIIGVTEKSGEKLGLGVTGPIASRTNTDATDRATRDVTSMDGRGYDCKKTDFDTHIKYSLLDAWAKFPDFQTRIRDLIVKRQALDRMLIGWNGVSAAASTNLGNNPLLQDVNKGWLQHMREQNAARTMDHGKAAGKVSYGDAAGDYMNLDALVYDAVMMLDPWFRKDPNLRVFVGRDLMHDKLFPLVNQPVDPTEKLAADMIISQRRLGGLQAVDLPYFPDGTILITTFKNLSIYWQEGARRRMVIDNPKRDRIENYESSSDDYVIEDLGAAAMVENIELYEAA